MDISKEIFLDFSLYLDFWIRCLNISIRIRSLAKEGNLEKLNIETENRQRLLNILKYHKEKIFKKLDQNDKVITSEFLNDYFQKIYKTVYETSILIQSIDSETLDFLSLDKIQTSKFISKFQKLKTYLSS